MEDSKEIITESAKASPLPQPPFIPLNNRVILRRVDSASATSSLAASGFVIPESSKEKATLCEVVAIPLRPYTTDIGAVLFCPVRVGDRALIGKYSGSEHKVKSAAGKDEELLFVRWDELLGVEPAEDHQIPLGFNISLPSADDLDLAAAEAQIKYTTGKDSTR